MLCCVHRATYTDMCSLANTWDPGHTCKHTCVNTGTTDASKQAEGQAAPRHPHPPIHTADIHSNDTVPHGHTETQNTRKARLGTSRLKQTRHMPLSHTDTLVKPRATDNPKQTQAKSSYLDVHRHTQGPTPVAGRPTAQGPMPALPRIPGWLPGGRMLAPDGHPVPAVTS